MKTLFKNTLLITLFMLSIISVNAQTYKVEKVPIPILKGTKIKTLKNAAQKIKATLVAPNGKHYFFTEKRYFRYSKVNGLEKIANIKPNWSGIPDNIDAVFVHPKNKKAYFFKGSKYNRYNFNTQSLDNNELSIARFWEGVPNDIDAVTNYPNGKIYFFKGDTYYRYDSTLKKVDKTALISKNWRGVPNNVAAALLHKNGNVYFFKGYQYFRYNVKLRRVDKIEFIGKGWKGLDFSRKNFTKYIPNKSKKGIDAALYNSPNDEVHFFRGHKVMHFGKQSGTTLVGQGNRIEVYGFDQEMKTYTIGASNWYSGIPQNIDAATPYFDNSRGTTHLFFKGNNIYFWNEVRKNATKGFNIKQTIASNIPYNIEAAAANESGELYIFKDNKYYVIDQLNPSHQRFQFKTTGKIKNKFPYAPNSMDAARWDYETNQFIFYKGLKYYTYKKVGAMSKKLFK